MSRKKKPELNQSVITEELLDKVAAFYSSSSSLSSLSSPDGDERGKSEVSVRDERSKDVKGSKNCASLREVAKHFNVSILKAKKLLITAGVYPMTDQIDLIHILREQGLTEKQIADRLGVSVAAVNASLPYEKVVYKLTIPPPMSFTTSNGQSGADGAGGIVGADASADEVVSARTVEADRVDLHRRRWNCVHS